MQKLESNLTLLSWKDTKVSFQLLSFYLYASDPFLLVWHVLDGVSWSVAVYCPLVAIKCTQTPNLRSFLNLETTTMLFFFSSNWSYRDILSWYFCTGSLSARTDLLPPNLPEVSVILLFFGSIVPLKSQSLSIYIHFCFNSEFFFLIVWVLSGDWWLICTIVLFLSF